MGISVDDTLDFLEPLAAVPSKPSSGARLYYYEDGTLHLTTTSGDAEIGATGPTGATGATGPTGTTGLTGAAGAAANWFSYSGVGTPTGIIGAASGDWCIREQDGEVFEYVSGAWVDQGFSTQGTTSQVYSSLSRAWPSALQTLPAATWTPVKLNTTSFDNGPNFNESTYAYTAPVSGFYRVGAGIQITALGAANAGDQVGAGVWKNGVVSVNTGAGFELGLSADTGTSMSFSGTSIIKLNAGEYIQLFGYSTVAANIVNADTSAFMDVQLVGSLTDAPISPNTGAKAFYNTTVAVTAGDNKVSINAVVEDLGGHMDTTTNHRYNVTSPGWYQVNGVVNANSTAAGEFYAPELFHGTSSGDTATATGDIIFATAAGQGLSSAVSDLMYCQAGDYIELHAYFYQDATIYGATVRPDINCLSVVKVDQPVPGPSNSGWYTPTLTNSWTNVSGDGVARYMKDALGFVHLEGNITGGTTGTSPFVLPAGFRPGQTIWSPASGYTTVPVAAAVALDTSGNFYIITPGGSTAIGINIPPFLAEN